MEFKKTTGEPPSANVTYWVVVGSNKVSCLDIELYQDRTLGTWNKANSTLSVSGVKVWPSEAAFNDAACDASKYLFVITGGGGGNENTRTWLQETPIKFVKKCS